VRVVLVLRVVCIPGGELTRSLITVFCTGPGDDEVALYSTTLLDVHPGLITSARLDVLPFWIGLRSPRSHLPSLFLPRPILVIQLANISPS
jgi:hypothetical protein